MTYKKLTKILGSGVITLSAFIMVTPVFSATPTVLRDGYVYQDYSNDYGSRAGVSGKIERVVDDRAFVVKGSGIFGSDVLVITAGDTELSESTMRNMSHNSVHVEGRAQALSVTQIEKQTGVNLSEEKLKEFNGKTVIVAQTIDIK